MSYALRTWCAAALLCVPLFSVSAEFPSSPGDRDLSRQRQEQLLRDQEEKLQELQHLPESSAQPDAQISDDVTCFAIHTIALQGVTLLSDDEQAAITQPLLNSCIGLGDINQLVKAVTNLYIQKGFITSRAYIPEQNLKSGILVIQVLEGKTSGIESGHDSGLSSRELLMAFPGLVGAPLNLRDLEQGIDQLNRLPSNNAQLKLNPGEQPGDTQIAIDNTPKKPWRVSLGKNNNGDESTGDRQWQSSLAWDSPLGLADQLTLGVGKDAISDRYRQSRSANLNYSVPYGYWTFAYGFSYSDYETRNTANGFSFGLTGNTRNHSFTINRVLQRDQFGKTALSAGVRHVRSRNFIEDNLIAVSSHQLTEFSLGLNHGRRLWKGFLNMDVAFQKGSTAFGAQKDHQPAAGQPRAQFSKYTATASYLLPFQLLEHNFTFSSLATGQWSHDVLYGPVRFSVGGLSSVRGFREQSLSGDSGGYWRNDVTWRVPVTLPAVQQVFHTLSVTAAYDAGVIHGGKYNPTRHGRLTSRALSMTLSGEHIDASVTFAESLSRPGVLQDAEHPVWFQFSLKI